MPKKAFLAFFVVLSLLLIPVQSYAEQGKVAIEVIVGGDANIKNQVKSIILKELREFPIIKIVDKFAEYKIFVSCINLGKNDSNVRGYVMGLVVTKRNYEKKLKKQLEIMKKIKDCAITVKDLVDMLSIDPEHLLFGIYHDGEYKPIVDKIIADIDINVIEPERRKMAK